MSTPQEPNIGAGAASGAKDVRPVRGAARCAEKVLFLTYAEAMAAGAALAARGEAVYPYHCPYCRRGYHNGHPTAPKVTATPGDWDTERRRKEAEREADRKKREKRAAGQAEHARNLARHEEKRRAFEERAKDRALREERDAGVARDKAAARRANDYWQSVIRRWEKAAR